MDALLTLLASYGGEADFSELAKQLKVHYSTDMVYYVLKTAHQQALVFRHPMTNKVLLLPKGQIRADDVVGKTLK
jgi:hypothetical protein